MKDVKVVLREGWFDKVVSFFKGTGTDAQRLANAWLSEQEIEVGQDLQEDFKNQVLLFVTNRYERALKAYEDDPQAQRKAARIIVSLLDKRFGGYIDDLIYSDEQMSSYKGRRRI